MSLDAMPAPDEFLHSNELKRPEQDGKVIVSALDEDTEDALVTVLATLFQMSKLDLCIFHGIYHGQTFDAIAKEMCLSKEGVRKRVMRMAAAHPVVRAFADFESRKGVGGRKRGEMRGGYTQPDLFGEEGG